MRRSAGPAPATTTPPLTQADAGRVTAIRRALAAGTFPLTPARLADAMIAERGLLIDGVRP